MKHKNVGEQITIPFPFLAEEKLALLECLAQLWPAAICEHEERDGHDAPFFGIAARGQVDCDFSELFVYKDEASYQLWERHSPARYRENSLIQFIFDESETMCICSSSSVSTVKKMVQKVRKKK